MHYILCGKEVSRVHICSKLTELEYGDFLFLDEIHALPKNAQEILYPAIDKNKTIEIDSTGKIECLTDKWISIQPFTLLAASDRAGELRNALRRRLPQVYTLQNYTVRELRAIVSHRCSEIGICLSPQATSSIAKVCRGTPRNIRHLLQRLSLYFPESQAETLGQKHVRDFLKGEGIDKNGLNSTDRKYLKIIMERNNKPTSLNSLALSLGCDVEYVSHEIEPHLVCISYVNIDRAGRSLTDKGIEAARRKAA